MDDAAIRLGILKCRDLVELYYGARMVTSIIENNQQGNQTTPQVLVGLDPRRIRLEIVLANRDTVNSLTANIGSPGSNNLGTSELIQLPPGGTVVIERNFLTDMESVTLPLEFQGSSSVIYSTRETFLTPLPADES